MKYFKHLLFLSILCSLVLFTNCGGEGEDHVADDTTDTTDDDTNTVLGYIIENIPLKLLYYIKSILQNHKQKHKQQ